jgi:hypothetical protein
MTALFDHAIYVNASPTRLLKASRRGARSMPLVERP